MDALYLAGVLFLVALCAVTGATAVTVVAALDAPLWVGGAMGGVFSAVLVFAVLVAGDDE